MANTKNQKADKKTPETKLDTVSTMLANKSKKEAEKQRKIYSAMEGIVIVRN